MRIVEMHGKNMDLTDAIKDHIEKKLSGVSKLVIGWEPCEIKIEAGKTSNHHNKGKIFLANLTMSVPGTVLKAEALEEDLYHAIDNAVDTLKRQVKKYKEKG